MKFKVSAMNKEGDTYEEVLDVADKFAVYRDIRERGDKVLDVTEESSGGISLGFINEFLHSVSQDEKVVLTKNMAAMLEAGLTASRAIGVMERQTRNPRLKKILNGISGDIKRGGTLSSAFAKYPKVFPALLVSMVHAGEESGKLSESLRVVSMQMERSSTLTKKIRGALMYPGIVLTAMVGIGIAMLIYVVPTLTATFSELGTELPPATKAIIAVSQFLSNYTLLALGGIIAFVIALIALARTPQGKSVFDWIFVHMPLIGPLVIETNSARTTRTLGSLLSSGVDMVLAISIAREVVGNSMYHSVLKEAEESVTKGDGLSAAFMAHPELYPPLVSEMIAVGEETGKLSDLLKETAEFYEESVAQQTKDLSTIIEPILMVVIGGAVGFFAYAMITPIYAISSGI